MPYEKHAALIKAWRARERREQSRYAMLAMVAAKCAGNKDKTQDDFMGSFSDDDTD